MLTEEFYWIVSVGDKPISKQCQVESLEINLLISRLVNLLNYRSLSDLFSLGIYSIFTAIVLNNRKTQKVQNRVWHFSLTFSFKSYDG